MATYKQNVGTTVVNYAGNYPGAVEGELWYDSSNYAWKYQYPNVTAAGTWRTGNSLNTARRGLGGTGASNSAALAFGGFENNPPTRPTLTESYNGTNWTEVNDLNVGRNHLGSAGTYTSALAFGGENPVVGNTESWNGTNWTEVNDLNTARASLSGAGADNTSALGFGGTPSGSAATESWNGTNWTEVNDLNNARTRGSGNGTVTSALYYSGAPGPAVAHTELWNGTNWTEVNNINTARDEGASAKMGDNTAALFFGGRNTSDAKVASAELWNGTNWTEQNDLSTATFENAGAGISTSALNFGGAKDPSTTLTGVTEEFTGAGAAVGVWSTGGSLNTERMELGSAGTYTAGLAFGGNQDPPNVAVTESYNGSSWSSILDGRLSCNVTEHVRSSSL